MTISVVFFLVYMLSFKYFYRSFHVKEPLYSTYTTMMLPKHALWNKDVIRVLGLMHAGIILILDCW